MICFTRVSFAPCHPATYASEFLKPASRMPATPGAVWQANAPAARAPRRRGCSRRRTRRSAKRLSTDAVRRGAVPQRKRRPSRCSRCETANYADERGIKVLSMRAAAMMAVAKLHCWAFRNNAGWLCLGAVAVWFSPLQGIARWRRSMLLVQAGALAYRSIHVDQAQR